MEKQYFHRVTSLSPTKFWINNPTRSQTDQAIDAGATGCTNNPSYTQKMIDHPVEGEYAKQLLAQVLNTAGDAGEAETALQRKLVGPVAEKFYPLYSKSHGTEGYVSIQGDPLKEEDYTYIVDDALKNRKLGGNICCKIPVTEAGLKAVAELVPMDVPINATEIMSVRQTVELCETYAKAAQKSGKYPKLYISHIAGIFDEYLKGVVTRDGISIEHDVLWQAGLAVARKIYTILHEREYYGTLVAGGVRDLHHFTEMVGAQACVTINWQGTADKLLENDYPAVHRFFNPVPWGVIDELLKKLPDFRKAYSIDGLEPEEFEDFGPVTHFRNSFIHSWERVLKLIEETNKGS